jgi:hypothetical protein
VRINEELQHSENEQTSREAALDHQRLQH